MVLIRSSLSSILDSILERQVLSDSKIFDYCKCHTKINHYVGVLYLEGCITNYLPQLHAVKAKQKDLKCGNIEIQKFSGSKGFTAIEDCAKDLKMAARNFLQRCTVLFNRIAIES